ncbi:hypothetical protein BG011_005155 [Mortierella polycephala]|uniref:Uncharacterized protein n=1 Tax=Mortierella polycephala TaxID=41804 RepID=A0A9P6PY55_9FUNG|nr:hypothetical protein BG011_005155 [Mortierella polycephala]
MLRSSSSPAQVQPTSEQKSTVFSKKFSHKRTNSVSKPVDHPNNVGSLLQPPLQMGAPSTPQSQGRHSSLPYTNASLNDIGDSFTFIRPPPIAHRNSPNSRQKWSPVVHTIAPNVVSHHTHGIQDDGTAMDVPVREIKRLTDHDFDQTRRTIPYPVILEPLYQRLYDYHVCLKSARKKVLEQQQLQKRLHRQQQNADTRSNNDASRDINKDSIQNETSTPQSQTQSQSQPLSETYFQHRISDLEQQLVQSRRAHHNLLQDHVLSLKRISSSCLPLPQSAIQNSSTAKISAKEANAIKLILASVSLGTSAATDLNSVDVMGPAMNLTKSSLSLHDAVRNAQLRLARFSNGRIGKHDAATATSTMTVTEKTTATTSAATPAPASATGSTSMGMMNSDSDQSLGTLVDQHMLLRDATTRLLCAETELGMLKLLMVQSMKEISGLEEEVIRKQTELTHHQKVFDNLLELNRLGTDAQICENQMRITELEVQIKKQEQEMEVALNTVKSLEVDIQNLEMKLSLKRTEHTGVDMVYVERVRELEQDIDELREELAWQRFRFLEMEAFSLQVEEAAKKDKEELDTTKMMLQRALEQNGDEGGQMIDYLEKQHKKKKAEMQACLIKAQKTNNRLNKELSTLTFKITRVETLNEELADQTAKDRSEIQVLKQEAERLQAQSSFTPESLPSPVDQANEFSEGMRENLTSLEIQIDELSCTLRQKELDLEQALAETERLTLQLEQDLAQQKQEHKEEMTKFAEEKKLHAQRERACQNASVTLFQNMATKLQTELAETQEKLRDTTLCWGHTKEQLQKCEQSYRRRKKDLEDTTRSLHEVEETMAKLGDAIGMLEMEKEANMILVRALEERDRELRDMEYRLRVLEEERE